MRKTKFIWAAFLPLFLLTTGCYTKVVVNFGNGTDAKIEVQSSETNQKVQISPGKFKKIPHVSGNLIVTAENHEKIRFSEVDVFELDRKYREIHPIIAPNTVKFNVMFGVDQQLYVLMPKRKTINEVEQPSGYPKHGEKLKN